MGGFNEAEWSKHYSSDLPLKFRYIYFFTLNYIDVIK